MIFLLLILFVFAVALVAYGWNLCRRQNRHLRRRIASLEAAADGGVPSVVSGAGGSSSDPTDESTTAARLRAYLRLMDKVINTIPHPVYFKADAGVLGGCNEAFARQVLGMAPEQAIGKRLDDLDGQALKALVAVLGIEDTTLAAGHPGGGREVTVTCADGLERDFMVATAGVAADDGADLGEVGVMLDLTAKNNAAREQIVREKLQGVLETAGAVCHELNQPLQAITGYAEMLAAGIDPAHPDYRWISKLAEETRRIAGITHKLQNITRYETRQYDKGSTLVDLNRASEVN